MTETWFIKHFGAVTALPILFFIMGLNVLEINLSYNNEPHLQNGITLLVLILFSYFIVKKLYKKYPKTILLYFAISLLIVQNLFISFGYQYTDAWRVHTPENAYEPNDFLWVIILPLTLAFALFWGFMFDVIKNKTT